MFEIRASIEVDAPLYAVWKIVSDADNEPLYWQNLTVSRVEENNKIVQTEVTVSLVNLITAETIRLHSNKLIKVSLNEGSLTGRSSIILKPIDGNKTRIEALWNIGLADVPLLFRGMMRNEIMKGTEEALDRIAKAVR